jgi:hypothetical protein
MLISLLLKMQLKENIARARVRLRRPQADRKASIGNSVWIMRMEPNLL